MTGLLGTLIARWRERARTYRQFKDPGRNWDATGNFNLCADELEAALATLPQQDRNPAIGEAFWRGFTQATYNRPGSLTTADELIAAQKEIERLRGALPPASPQAQAQEPQIADIRTLVANRSPHLRKDELFDIIERLLTAIQDARLTPRR